MTINEINSLPDRISITFDYSGSMTGRVFYPPDAEIVFEKTEPFVDEDHPESDGYRITKSYEGHIGMEDVLRIIKNYKPYKGEAKFKLAESKKDVDFSDYYLMK